MCLISVFNVPYLKMALLKRTNRQRLCKLIGKCGKKGRQRERQQEQQQLEQHTSNTEPAWWKEIENKCLVSMLQRAAMHRNRRQVILHKIRR